MTVRRFVLLCAMALSAGVSDPPEASAQQPVIVPDRPGFTETTQVVGPHTLQFEMGSSLELDGSGDSRSRTFAAPLGLIRIGVSPTLELRVSGDGDVLSSAGRGLDHATVSGGSDVEVGAKCAFLNNQDAGLTMAVIPMLSLPVGSPTTSSGTYDPAVELSWDKALGRGFELSGNVNVSRLHDSAGRYAEHAYSLSLSHAFGAHWSGYGEAYGLLASGHHHGAAWTFDAGVTRTIKDNVQLDAEAGRGLSAASPDWFLGVGMGFRMHIPRHGH